jgi:hypothetical protein
MSTSITESSSIIAPSGDDGPQKVAKESAEARRHSKGLRRRWLAERPTSLIDEDEDLSEVPGLHEVKELLARDDETSVLEKEEVCPLPSTPIDAELLDCEV